MPQSERKISVQSFNTNLFQDTKKDEFKSSFFNSPKIEQNKTHNASFDSFGDNSNFKQNSFVDDIEPDQEKKIRNNSFLQHSKVMEEDNIFTPLKEEEANFSFCNEEENIFTPSLSNNELLEQVSQKAIKNFRSQNVISEVTPENMFCFNSMIPSKEELFVPSFMDDGKLRSFNRLLCVKRAFSKAGEIHKQ